MTSAAGLSWVSRLFINRAALYVIDDEYRTLEELDGENWGPPETAPTGMVARCLRLRRTPLHLLSHSDLRLLISQKIGLKYTVPKGLKLISQDALIEVDFYPGDLLCALLQIDKNYWSEKTEELKWLMSVAQSVTREHAKIFSDCESFLAAHRNKLN
jgi:contact-dependent growth inhibition (CDI) system CdiI-like immunity protein